MILTPPTEPDRINQLMFSVGVLLFVGAIVISYWPWTIKGHKR